MTTPHVITRQSTNLWSMARCSSHNSSWSRGITLLQPRQASVKQSCSVLPMWCLLTCAEHNIMVTRWHSIHPCGQCRFKSYLWAFLPTVPEFCPERLLRNSWKSCSRPSSGLQEVLDSGGTAWSRSCFSCGPPLGGTIPRISRTTWTWRCRNWRKRMPKFLTFSFTDGGQSVKQRRKTRLNDGRLVNIVWVNDGGTSFTHTLYG